jgi:hypothetical protein
VREIVRIFDLSHGTISQLTTQTSFVLSEVPPPDFIGTRAPRPFLLPFIAMASGFYFVIMIDPHHATNDRRQDYRERYAIYRPGCM